MKAFIVFAIVMMFIIIIFLYLAFVEHLWKLDLSKLNYKIKSSLKLRKLNDKKIRS